MNDNDITVTPNQLRLLKHYNQRWGLLPIPEKPTNFIQGLVSLAGAGDPHLKTGLTIYVYAANTSMKDMSFFSSDGDMLIGMFYKMLF